jgi:hypothetical protein
MQDRANELSAEGQSLHSQGQFADALRVYDKLINEYSKSNDANIYSLVSDAIYKKIELLHSLLPEEQHGAITPLYDILISRCYASSRRKDAAEAYLAKAAL